METLVSFLPKILYWTWYDVQNNFCVDATVAQCNMFQFVIPYQLSLIKDYSYAYKVTLPAFFRTIWRYV